MSKVSGWRKPTLDTAKCTRRWARATMRKKSWMPAKAPAIQLKNPELLAKIKGFQGDRYLCRGEFKAARPLYKEADSEAAHSTDRQLTLLSHFNLARLDAEESGSRAPIAACSPSNNLPTPPA